MTRRAGWLILGSKSNTVSGQIVPERACDKFMTFASKCQFLTLLHAFDFRFYFISGEISLRAFQRAINIQILQSIRRVKLRMKVRKIFEKKVIKVKNSNFCNFHQFFQQFSAKIESFPIFFIRVTRRAGQYYPRLEE